MGARVGALALAGAPGLDAEGRRSAWLRRVDIKAAATPWEEGLDALPVTATRGSTTVEHAGRASTQVDTRIGGMRVRLEFVHNVTEGAADSSTLAELAAETRRGPYGDAFAAQRQTVRDVDLDLAASRATATVGVLPLGGSAETPLVTMVDSFVVALQLGQVLLYELDGVERRRSHNLWMRSTTLTADAPPRAVTGPLPVDGGARRQPAAQQGRRRLADGVGRRRPRRRADPLRRRPPAAGGRAHGVGLLSPTTHTEPERTTMRLGITGTYSSGKTFTAMALGHFTGIPRTRAKTMREILPDAAPGKTLEQCTAAELLQMIVVRHTERAVHEARLAPSFLSDGCSLQEWIYGMVRVTVGINPNDSIGLSHLETVEKTADLAYFEEVVGQLGLAFKRHVKSSYDAFVHLRNELPLAADGHRPGQRPVPCHVRRDAAAGPRRAGDVVHSHQRLGRRATSEHRRTARPADGHERRGRDRPHRGRVRRPGRAVGVRARRRRPAGAGRSGPVSRAAVLVGLGAVVPPRIITNDDLVSQLDTSHEWIHSRTGISSRHVVEPGTATSDLAVEAGRRALTSAGVGGVDLVVLATATPDSPLPGTAPAVAARLGLEGAPAFDVAAVCSGFVYALATAAGAIAAGIADRVLVIGAETFTSIVDPGDRDTAPIFGDGAGAVLLRAGAPDEQGALVGFDLGSDGARADLIAVPGGGSVQRSGGRPVDPASAWFRMQGRAVYRHAVARMTESTRAVLKQADWDVADVDAFVGHQANARILAAVASGVGVPAGRAVIALEHVGNTSAASIPLALVHAAVQGRFSPGDRVVLTAFGGGLTWGSTALTWPSLPRVTPYDAPSSGAA